MKLNVNSINAENFGEIIETTTNVAIVGSPTQSISILLLKFGEIVLMYIPEFSITPASNGIGYMDYVFPNGFKPVSGGFIGYNFCQLNNTTSTRYIIYEFNFNQDRIQFYNGNDTDSNFQNGTPYKFLYGSYLYYYV